MNKRYQVFISSTYTDLTEERRYVMQALMEMDCIPAGMELFPAADEEQWEFIKKVIDDSDYYLLIIGGRYGSTSADGISYTEREYDYALKKGLYIIRLIHKNLDAIPLGKSEKNPQMQKKLLAFRDKATNGKLAKFWETPDELKMQTVSGLIYAIRNHPAIGFVRANLVPDDSSLLEIRNLHNKITELETQLAYISNNAPADTEELAQGDESLEIRYTFKTSSPHDLWGNPLYDDDSIWHHANLKISWNIIFSTIAPLLVNEAAEYTLQEQLAQLVRDYSYNIRSKKKEFAGKEFSEFSISDKNFQTIKIQLRALGLITQSKKNRSVKDNATYWTLTPYGDNVMTRLIAIKRNS